MNAITPQKQRFPQTARDIVSIFFFKKRVFLLTFLGVMGVALLVSFLFPPIYEVKAQLVVKPQYERPLIFDTGGTRFSASNQVDPQTLNTVLHLMKSPQVMREVVIRLGLADPDQDGDVLAQANAIEDRLQAEPLSLSNIIQLSYRGRNPEEITHQLNTIIDVYIAYHIQVNQTLKGRLDFFDKQTMAFQKKYRDLTDALADESMRLRIANPDIQKENILKLIKDLEFRKAELRANAKALEERVIHLQTAKKDIMDKDRLVALSSDILSTYPGLVEMERTLAQLIINRQRAHSDYHAESKQVKDAETQYRNMKRQINRHMDQIMDGVRTSITALNHLLDGKRPIAEILAQHNEPGVNYLTFSLLDQHVQAPVAPRRLLEFFEESRNYYSWIIIDAPPFSFGPALFSLARATDGVVIVARAGLTRLPAINALSAEMKEYGVRPVGVILNYRKFPVPKALLRFF